MQFCNLSEVVIREDDDLDTLLDKVETATWLGVIQSSFTYFPYLRKEWKKNCDVEALLGVSLTGQMDNPSVLTSEALAALKSRVLRISRKASGILGTKMPAATTCVKAKWYCFTTCRLSVWSSPKIFSILHPSL